MRRFQRLRHLQQALQLVWQSTPRLTLISMALLVVQSLLPLLALSLTRQTIDTISLALRKGAERHLSNSVYPVLGLIVAAACVALAMNLIGACLAYVKAAQAEAVKDHVYEVLHAKSISLDLGYYENPQFYDALHQSQTEATYRPVSILQQLLDAAQGAISLVAIALFLFSLHWLIALVLLGAVLPWLLLKLRYSRRLYKRWMEWTPQERQAEYRNWMLTQESCAKEVRLFGLGEIFQQQFQQFRRQIRRDRLALSRLHSFSQWLAQSGAAIIMFSVWGFMALQTLQGTITIGSLVMFYQAFQQAQNLLQQLLDNLSGIYENSLFLANFYQFLNLESQVPEPPSPLPVPQPLREGIRFEQVSFHYPHSQRLLLKDVSFQIHAGETVALVGKNGAGKTSLIKLLCRLYDPTAGRILLDGVDLRDLSTADLRQQLTVVFQDYVHYNLSAGDNIAVGQGLRSLDSEKIEAAAQASGADRVIERLPSGYETMLGNQFAEGMEISIGEWQKLAIARAFLRPAQIMVLDEPTSALDAEAEMDVLDQFRQLTHNRTSILISHRLSTVKLADRILVLEDGQIIENGSHHQLMQLRGTYYHLFETQAQQYR
jgi:ATP-binding cassette, subfamily B, bacterial